jgi:hypothetical protein
MIELIRCPAFSLGTLPPLKCEVADGQQGDPDPHRDVKWSSKRHQLNGFAKGVSSPGSTQPRDASRTIPIATRVKREPVTLTDVMNHGYQGPSGIKKIKDDGIEYRISFTSVIVVALGAAHKARSAFNRLRT